MKVTLLKPTERTTVGSSVEKVTCALNNSVVEIRQSSDGTCMIVAIVKGHVSIEPRSSEVRLVVNDTGKRTR